MPGVLSSIHAILSERKANVRGEVVATNPDVGYMIMDLDEEVSAKGVSLVFAEMKYPVRERIERYDLTRTLDPTHFFPTLDAAVAAFSLGNGLPSAPTDGDGRPARDTPAART